MTTNSKRAVPGFELDQADKLEEGILDSELDEVDELEEAVLDSELDHADELESLERAKSKPPRASKSDLAVETFSSK